jgi:hypothetical protein
MFGPGEYVPDPTEGIVNANDLPMPVAYLLAAENSIGPLVSRLRGA